ARRTGCGLVVGRDLGRETDFLPELRERPLVAFADVCPAMFHTLARPPLSPFCALAATPAALGIDPSMALPCRHCSPMVARKGSEVVRDTPTPPR
ncbi:MAG: hypothetical protein LC644_02460, partial [Pseudonocardia sp.]|nr:hypothetical protein [Pseudonocardia sp.]